MMSSATLLLFLLLSAVTHAASAVSVQQVAAGNVHGEFEPHGKRGNSDSPN